MSLQNVLIILSPLAISFPRLGQSDSFPIKADSDPFILLLHYDSVLCCQRFFCYDVCVKFETYRIKSKTHICIHLQPWTQKQTKTIKTYKKENQALFFECLGWKLLGLAERPESKPLRTMRFHAQPCGWLLHISHWFWLLGTMPKNHRHPSGVSTTLNVAAHPWASWIWSKRGACRPPCCRLCLPGALNTWEFTHETPDISYKISLPTLSLQNETLNSEQDHPSRDILSMACPAASMMSLKV